MYGQSLIAMITGWNKVAIAMLITQSMKSVNMSVLSPGRYDKRKHTDNTSILLHIRIHTRINWEAWPTPVMHHVRRRDRQLGHGRARYRLQVAEVVAEDRLVHPELAADVQRRRGPLDVAGRVVELHGQVPGRLADPADLVDDFTIADFVADLRAPTPSAAAELLTEAQHKVEERLEQLHRRLNQACRYLLMRAQERFARLSAPAAFARMRNALARRQQRVDELQYQLDAAWHRQSRQMTERLQKLEGRLLRQDVSHRMRMVRERLAMLDGRIGRAQQELLLRWQARHASAEARLQPSLPWQC